MILAEIRDRLNRQWNLHSAKMDWPGMETVLVGILNNEGILPETRLALCKTIGFYIRDEAGTMVAGAPNMKWSDVINLCKAYKQLEDTIESHKQAIQRNTR